jgi:hypothetical protein
MALVAAPILFSAAPTEAAGPQASVGTEDDFWDAWTDPDVTQIDLTASIQLHSGNGNGTCSPNTLPERDADKDTLVDGHGFTLTQNCDQNAVLYMFSSSGSPTLTIQNITLTHAGAPTPTATGNGAVNEDGDVVVHSSTITGNWVPDGACDADVSALFLCAAGGGGIAANGDVEIDNSTVSNNRSPVGGGIYANGTVVATNTTVTGNRALTDSDATAGGGIYADDGGTLTDMTVSDNFAGCEGECSAFGGGVAAFGPVNAFNSLFNNNTVGCEAECGNYGGGLFVAGPLSISHSTLDSNHASCENECAADGGGFFAAGDDFFETSTSGPFGSASAAAEVEPGPVTIIDSYFHSNVASTTDSPGGLCDCTGGGFFVFDETEVNVSGSTFSNNVALFAGGAMAIDNSGNAKVVNSTITANSSGELGAIAADDDVNLTLTYDTITNNVVHAVPPPADLHSTFVKPFMSGSVHATADEEPASVGGDATVTVFGTVITGPVGGPNCAVEGLTSQGWNYSDDTSCGFTNAGKGDNQAAGNDPLLGALGDNGGPTPTQLPVLSSPLVNAIPVASCQADSAAGVTVDQRGIARPQGAGCDIGSVEVQPPSPAFTG